jgi:hypothetical protein
VSALYPRPPGRIARRVLALLDEYGSLTNKELWTKWGPEKPRPESLNITVHRLKERGMVEAVPGRGRVAPRYRRHAAAPPVPAARRAAVPLSGAVPSQAGPVTWHPLGRDWQPGGPVVYLDVADWQWSRQLAWRLAPDGGAEHDGQLAGIRLHYLIADARVEDRVVARDGNLLNCCRANLHRRRLRGAIQ